MQTKSYVRKCVMFLAIEKTDGSFHFCGTAFYVTDTTRDPKINCLITAKHVIEKAKGMLVDNICLRVNMKDGTSKWYETNLSDWVLHPDSNVDVAGFVTAGFKEWDHLTFSLADAATKEIIDEYQIDAGDETFIVGLFSNHHGDNRNIPIVRVGNIAAMPDEKVVTSEHTMDAYLIEARSIGGLSGSPVFVNLGTTRLVNGEVFINQNNIQHYLIGVVYGHYDTKDKEDKRINMGIAIVTPIEKVIELYNFAAEITIEGERKRKSQG